MERRVEPEQRAPGGIANCILGSPCLSFCTSQYLQGTQMVTFLATGTFIQEPGFPSLKLSWNLLCLPCSPLLSSAHRHGCSTTHFFWLPNTQTCPVPKQSL